MVPTVLEALGLEAPTTIKGVTQSPIEGYSFAHAFNNAKAPNRHLTQYFEMFGHRSLYHEGWRAVCPWPGTSFTEAGKGFGATMDAKTLTEQDGKHWELYHLEKDFAENHNVAATNRDKLIEMIGMWYVEAGKYNVLPIDARGTLRLGDSRPQIAGDRKRYQYLPGHAVRTEQRGREHFEPGSQHRGRGRHSERRGRRCPAVTRRQRRRVLLLHAGWQAALRV